MTVQLDPYEEFGPTDEDAYWYSDADKLRLLADWFDLQDQLRGVTESTDVQDDLRRIADELDEREYEWDEGWAFWLLIGIGLFLLAVCFVGL